MGPKIRSPFPRFLETSKSYVALEEMDAVPSYTIISFMSTLLPYLISTLLLLTPNCRYERGRGWLLAAPCTLHPADPRLFASSIYWSLPLRAD